MTQKRINAMLQGIIEGYADAKGYPIAWPNVEFTPPQDGPWLEISVIPAQSDAIDVQQTAIVYRGICQVSIHAKPGTGSQYLDDISNEIAALYPLSWTGYDTGLMLYPVSPVTIYDGLDAPGGYTVPISFEYQAN